MSEGKVMVALFAILIAAVVLMKPDHGGLLEAVQSDDVLIVADDDPAMLAAFGKARSTLDRFLEVAAAPPPNTESFAVKVAVADGSRKEYFWISPFAMDGQSFSGRVTNTPQVVSNVAEGDEIRFGRADVVDWTYENLLEKKMYGNFTACALLVHQSEEDAAAIKAQYGLDCDT